MEKKVKRDQYFEGVIQLRNPTQEIVDFVADEIGSDGNVKIAKTEKSQNGIDIYVSSNKFLRHIGRRLSDKFAGQLVESKRLFCQDRQSAKILYRGCILFRHYDIAKGSKIKYRGEEYTVISFGRDIFAKDQENRKVHLKYDCLN